MRLSAYRSQEQQVSKARFVRRPGLLGLAAALRLGCLPSALLMSACLGGGTLGASEKAQGGEAISSDSMAVVTPPARKQRVSIPLVAEKGDRSPGIRVNAMPFGEVDLTSIWGMKCDEEILLYLDAGSGDLFALVDADKNLPDETICTAYGSGRYAYSVLFDAKKMRFIVQNKPVYRPI